MQPEKNVVILKSLVSRLIFLLGRGNQRNKTFKSAKSFYFFVSGENQARDKIKFFKRKDGQKIPLCEFSFLKSF